MFVLIIYGGVFLAIMLLALLFFTLSVQSRKRYTCPNCGERIHMEHMEASHCNTCGAPLGREYGD